MRWILPIIIAALTWGFLYIIPYAARIGSALMGNMGWMLLPGALIVTYIGFVGPLWGKALRPFRSNPDLPWFPPRPNPPQ